MGKPLQGAGEGLKTFSSYYRLPCLVAQQHRMYRRWEDEARAGSQVWGRSRKERKGRRGQAVEGQSVGRRRGCYSTGFADRGVMCGMTPSATPPDTQSCKVA